MVCRAEEVAVILLQNQSDLGDSDYSSQSNLLNLRILRCGGSDGNLWLRLGNARLRSAPQ